MSPDMIVVGLATLLILAGVFWLIDTRLLNKQPTPEPEDE